MNNLATAARRVLSKYATFSGRAPRPEFWWWTLAVFLALLILGLIESLLLAPLLGFGIGDEDAGQPLSALASLALILPNLAVGARRLHDTGRTGWWLLIGLVPIVGILVLIYFYVQPSDPGDNDYGAPKPWAPAG